MSGTDSQIGKYERLRLLRSIAQKKVVGGPRFDPAPRGGFRDWGELLTDIQLAQSALLEALPQGDYVRAVAAQELLDEATNDMRRVLVYDVVMKAPVLVDPV